ncbi:MAG: cytidine deaminase [Lachnospiraceae bacterium]|nr:cytidine deaminase [Lachnospiraceae bacterium]
MEECEIIHDNRPFDKRRLIRSALDAREYAYAPYSHFTVGAALLTADGEIFTGVNIENASYGAANCAERTAIFKAVSEGRKCFKAIAIAGGDEKGKPLTYAYPCGICRQVMSEFCDDSFVILAARDEDDYVEMKLSELLPYGFKLCSLSSENGFDGRNGNED